MYGHYRLVYVRIFVFYICLAIQVNACYSLPDVLVIYKLGLRFIHTVTTIPATQERRGNVLFNDTLNTFYLCYIASDIMVKDYSEKGKENHLPPISSKGSFISSISHTTLCYTRCDRELTLDNSDTV